MGPVAGAVGPVQGIHGGPARRRGDRPAPAARVMLMRAIGMLGFMALLALAAAPSLAMDYYHGAHLYENTVLIPIGDSACLSIPVDNGTLSFRIEVVAGGVVDVYLCVPRPPPIYPLTRYSYESVGIVTGRLPDAPYTTVYLVIDNSGAIGMAPVSDVTVNVTWAVQDIPLSVAGGGDARAGSVAWAVVLATAAAVAIVAEVAIYRRAQRDERGGRAPRRGAGRVYEPAPLSPTGGVNICPSCRGVMRTDPISRTTYCPRCTLAPPPTIEGQAEVLWEPGQLELVLW